MSTRKRRGGWMPRDPRLRAHVEAPEPLSAIDQAARERADAFARVSRFALTGEPASVIAAARREAQEAAAAFEAVRAAAFATGRES